MKQHVEVVVVGAGPAGISCAIAAKKRDLEVVMIDRGNVVNSIIGFPANMKFFSTSDVLELGDVPFNSRDIRPDRVEAVKYYQSVVRHYGITCLTESDVIGVEKTGDSFRVIYIKAGTEQHIEAGSVIISTGFFDSPNKLGIPGEDLDHVSHYYCEPFKHFGQKVVVVGGKNSAVEAALDLHRHGAQVSLVHRRTEIKESVKYWIIPDIENRLKEGKIKAYFNSQLSRIERDSISISSNGKEKKLAADAVYLLTGYHPDSSLLKKCNIHFDEKTLEPLINRDTLESSVERIYLAGAINAGRNANKIFIENSRDHGEIILSHLASKVGK